MGRRWTVEIEGNKHLIAGEYGEVADSRILVDGNVVYTWHALQSGDLPKEDVTIKIGTKSGVLKAKGFFHQNLELFVEGRKIQPDKK